MLNPGTCADSWRNYRQAVEQWNQRYVKRQQGPAALHATVPLQQQVGDLNQLVADQQAAIQRLTDQMQAQSTDAEQQMQATSTAALQAQAAAHTLGLQQGAGVSVGAALVLFGVIFAVRRMATSIRVIKNPQTHAAAAGE